MNEFDCAVCKHSIHRHTVTRWPAFTKFCADCDCGGYTPKWRSRSRWDDDLEAGAIG